MSYLICLIRTQREQKVQFAVLRGLFYFRSTFPGVSSSHLTLSKKNIQKCQTIPFSIPIPLPGVLHHVIIAVFVIFVFSE